MSIIYDALKKVENSLMNSGGQKKEAPVPQVKAVPPKINKTPGFKPKVFLLVILLACLGVFIANMVMKKPASPIVKNEPQSLPPAKEKEALPKEAPVELIKPIEPADKRKQLQSQLVLNGVFFSGDEGYALINNHIMKTGDSIEGATVVKITQEEVELSYEGANFKLSTRSQ